jgi:hypothetical protein
MNRTGCASEMARVEGRCAALLMGDTAALDGMQQAAQCAEQGRCLVVTISGPATCVCGG